MRDRGTHTPQPNDASRIFDTEAMVASGRMLTALAWRRIRCDTRNAALGFALRRIGSAAEHPSRFSYRQTFNRGLTCTAF